MAFKISLNGANYVDAGRQQAFEAALAESKDKFNHPGGNGYSPAASGIPAARQAVDPTPAPQAAAADAAPPSVVVVQDYDRVLEGLERGLAKSYDHQSETLKVHQQYLSNQAAYANIFAQLMQEQGALVNGDAPVSGQSDVLLQILERLSRSVAQFHEHQAETLTVHNQFLNQQAAYAQAFVDLLETQYGSALTGATKPAGNGNGNGHHAAPARQTLASMVPSAAAVPQPVPVAKVAPAAPAPQIAQPVQTPVVDVSPASALSGTPAIDAEELGGALLEIVSEKTGYPAEMLDMDMDMEADLGIDSIKRVEILGALQDAYPTLPEVETEALAELRTLGDVLSYMTTETAEAAALDAAVTAEAPQVAVTATPEVAPAAATVGAAGLENLGDELLVIVSEKTGYPAEMLELDMDMEADLGIDSIKRVEILGALQDMHPDLPEVDAEALSELRTLAQILDYMQDGVAAKKA